MVVYIFINKVRIINKNFAMKKRRGEALHCTPTWYTVKFKKFLGLVRGSGESSEFVSPANYRYFVLQCNALISFKRVRHLECT